MCSTHRRREYLPRSCVDARLFQMCTCSTIGPLQNIRSHQDAAYEAVITALVESFGLLPGAWQWVQMSESREQEYELPVVAHLSPARSSVASSVILLKKLGWGQKWKSPM